MILVAGLGNPGPRYRETRHNAGFMLVDALALQAERVAAFETRFFGEFCACTLWGTDVGLLKPSTFMNDSGRSVLAAATFLKAEFDAIVVVHDELDLPFGELRLKRGGGDGGHRGLRSISAELGSPDYARLRLGIGRPEPDFQGDITDFVLQAFALEDRVVLQSMLDRASEAVKAILSDGIQHAMNRTNQRTVR